jgi:hypothetical protein
LRLELRATWLGGMRILDRIEDCRVRHPAAPAGHRHLGSSVFVWRTLTWRASRDRAPSITA